MRRLHAFILLIASGSFVFNAQAASMALNFIDGPDFYQALPNQSPLAEQFTTMVNSPPEPIKIVQKSPVRVAIMLFGSMESIDNKALLLSFKQRMQELNIDYRLDIYIDRSEHGKDLAPYFKMEANQPDYIVMTKLGFIQRRFLERFLHLGKPKVILYDFASPLTHWMRYPPLMYVGFDQELATKKLASYLNRQLPVEANISALVLPEGYLGHVRCDLFLDEMVKFGRHINVVRVVSDNKDDAFYATQVLLGETTPDFIFSCSQNISEGVVAVIKDKELASIVQTNAWGLSSSGLSDLKNKRVKLSMFFMKDNLSVAVAEAIKLDLEGRNMPNLYMANATLVPASLGLESLSLMIDKVYQYSAMLWQK
jgi:autoinducer 2-binding protein LuxP